MGETTDGKAFWREYQEFVRARNVKPKNVQYYVRWVLQFQDALPDKPLETRTLEDVQSYMDAIVGQNRYQDWQVNQISHIGAEIPAYRKRVGLAVRLLVYAAFC